MRIKQKLSLGFVFISFLIFGFSFGINLLVQNKTFRVFQEIAGEALPGDIALSRMTTELYRTVILLDKYEQSRDTLILKEMEISLALMDIHKTTHELYHIDDELTPKVDRLVQTFSREVARYKLLLQKESKDEEVEKVRNKIDVLLEEFLQSLNPVIDQSIASSYQKLKDVEEMINESHLLLLAGAMFILGFTLFLSFYIAHLFSKSLKVLRDAAQQIGAGNLKITLPVNTNDEIGDLARAFNNMSGNLENTQKDLQDKHQKLQKHKDSLEEQIYLRTEELQKSNMTLKNTVDELNSAQAHLIETEKMASLGSVIAGVANEINTPLGVSIASATKLHDDLLLLKNDLQVNEISDKNTYEKIETYIDRAEYLYKILNDNLEFSEKLINSFKGLSVEKEQYSADWREINLFDYVNDIVSSVEEKLIKHNVSINNRCDNDIIIYTSPGILNQIICTLISNSLIHAFEPGQDGQIVISAQEYKNHIRIEYHDNGKGISDEHISHVFEPFFSTDSGSKEGTGLGLSMVYNLISGILKGQIKVQSRLDEGTNFYIELPVIPESAD